MNNLIACRNNVHLYVVVAVGVGMFVQILEILGEREWEVRRYEGWTGEVKLIFDHFENCCRARLLLH